MPYPEILYRWLADLGNETSEMKKLLDNLRITLAHKGSIHSYWLEKHIKEFSFKIGIDNKFPLILDVGSRKQPYRSIFRFQEYVAIDIEKGEADLIADICYLPLKDKVADLVICTEVLEHVQNTEDALKNLNRVIKKGGVLILSTPLLIGEHDFVDYFRFTEQALRYYLGKYGFEIVELKRRGGIFSALYGILRSIPSQILPFTTNTPTSLQTNQRDVFRNILFLVLSMVSLLLVKIVVILDCLDKRKVATLGYELCCIKMKN